MSLAGTACTCSLLSIAMATIPASVHVTAFGALRGPAVELHEQRIIRNLTDMLDNLGQDPIRRSTLCKLRPALYAYTLRRYKADSLDSSLSLRENQQ